MSSDNGVYLLKSPSEVLNHDEYRVAHLQNIENVDIVDWDAGEGFDNPKEVKYTDNPDIRIKNAREMWKNCKVFSSEEEALVEAKKMLDEIYICEYGICFIEIPRVF